ncbi:MAG: nitroreductase [Abitibacteriaceae bacterium]|nr:nitroreductase [Abditibacteriaceae bacterium]MBV9866200.1 nitroreductase [Abditibacteriaceae bacterium]
MDALEAMRTRRSIAKLRNAPVPRELIEQALAVAVWAPNHKHTEPWRFFVFSGDSRQKLADAFAENYKLDHPDASAEELAGPGHKTANRVLAAPVTIVVTSDVGRSEMETLENYAATAVATEHILLAAHALGLGAYWRTGEGVYTAPRNAVKELLNVPESAQIVAFLLIGYPDTEAKAGQRIPYIEKTQWFE